MEMSTIITTRIRTQKTGDGVLVVTIDGPETKNSIGVTQYEDLRSAFVDAGEDREIGAIVLEGANGFFSSGGNVKALKESREMTMAQVSRNTDALLALILSIRNCPKPVIAAVEGGAAGLGLSLALSCDMIVAAEGAKFTAAYVKIGLTPDGGGTFFLREALPRQLVSELCMLGRSVTAERLHAAGVVNEVTTTGAARDAALALGREAAQGARQAIATIKQEIAEAPQNRLADHVEMEGRGINAARFGDEAGEGLSAFLEKRKPRFPR
jgi:enoyl-CoA hydratase/carnithine racemase